MSTQVIRNVDSSVLNKLGDLAKKKKISREEYCRRLMERAAVAGEVIEIEDRYINLINILEERTSLYNDIIDHNNFLLEKVATYLEEKNEEDL